MSARRIVLQPLTAKTFAPFGDVLEATGEPDKIINAGLCDRFHDLANLDFTGEGARAGISVFRSKARTLPYTLDMVERHPLGSQAFMPMSADPFMVIVAPDDGDAPGTPLAFLTEPRTRSELSPQHLARCTHAPDRQCPVCRSGPHR